MVMVRVCQRKGLDRLELVRVMVRDVTRHSGA